MTIAKKWVLIGGTFDSNGGKPSSIIDRICYSLEAYAPDVEMVCVNGGYIEVLGHIIKNICPMAQVVFWWPNISNNISKMRSLKALYPQMIMVSSKRNIDEQYSFMELISRALNMHSNLVVEFSKKSEEKVYRARVFDPLGNVWCDRTDDLSIVAEKLVERISFLEDVHRVHSWNAQDESNCLPHPEDMSFFDVVKEYAEVFHELIHPHDCTRFLGNASFRCQRGFPSFKSNNGAIFVSRRNVDKRTIGPDDFVQVLLGDNKGIDSNVRYYGNIKPSVDTPVHLHLYDMVTSARYMIHSHTYIRHAPFTGKCEPCGSLGEVKAIVEVLGSSFDVLRNKIVDSLAINLRGHGSLVMSRTVDGLRNIDYVSREVPEIWGELSNGKC